MKIEVELVLVCQNSLVSKHVLDVNSDKLYNFKKKVLGNFCEKNLHHIIMKLRLKQKLKLLKNFCRPIWMEIVGWFFTLMLKRRKLGKKFSKIDGSMEKLKLYSDLSQKEKH